MELEVGAVFAGKVTGITKFGAFVSIPNGRSGLVHISEIANTYVDDVSKHLTVGQDVTVKLISIDNNGRINLSIKQTLEQPSRQRQVRTPSPIVPQNKDESAPKTAESSFEDKLKRFMQDSDSKISGLYADKRTSRRRNNNRG